MPHNQTIDGVPRHWAEIEAAVRGAFQDGKKDYNGCMRERLRELRALLDAPAKPVEPVAYPTLSALLADLPEGYNKDDVAFGWNECVDNHRCSAAQPAPVTYQQVFKAYEYAEAHPHKYLRGTTNWCAAVAYALNAQKPLTAVKGDPGA